MDRPPQTHYSRRRVPPPTAPGGGGSPHDPGRGRGRNRGAPLADRVHGARIAKPAPRPRAGSGLSPGPAAFARGRSPGGARRGASPAGGGGGESLASAMRDARAMLAAGRGPVVVAGAGERSTGFLAPGWRVSFEGPDGWTYGSASMFALAQWAKAAAEGRVRGLPVEGEMNEEECRAKYTKLWKRIIQSTDARKHASMCAEAGLDWSAWRGGRNLVGRGRRIFQS